MWNWIAFDLSIYVTFIMSHFITNQIRTFSFNHVLSKFTEFKFIIVDFIFINSGGNKYVASFKKKIQEGYLVCIVFSFLFKTVFLFSNLSYVEILCTWMSKVNSCTITTVLSSTAVMPLNVHTRVVVID